VETVAAQFAAPAAQARPGAPAPGRAEARAVVAARAAVHDRRATRVLDHTADAGAGVHRLQHVAHGVGALLPGEVPATRFGLGAELVAQDVFG